MYLSVSVSVCVSVSVSVSVCVSVYVSVCVIVNIIPGLLPFPLLLSTGADVHNITTHNISVKLMNLDILKPAISQIKMICLVIVNIMIK